MINAYDKNHDATLPEVDAVKHGIKHPYSIQFSNW